MLLNAERDSYSLKNQQSFLDIGIGENILIDIHCLKLEFSLRIKQKGWELPVFVKTVLGTTANIKTNTCYAFPSG